MPDEGIAQWVIDEAKKREKYIEWSPAMDDLSKIERELLDLFRFFIYEGQSDSYIKQTSFYDGVRQLLRRLNAEPGRQRLSFEHWLREHRGIAVNHSVTPHDWVELGQDYADDCAQFFPGERQEEWVSVEERRPERGIFVAVAVKGLDYAVPAYVGDLSFGKQVTHWHALPAPPSAPAEKEK